VWLLLLRMGAGLAAAGRPLGATVEVRLQRHGARRVEEQCQNDTVQILFFFFFLLLLLLLLYFFYLWGPKNGLQQMPPLYNAYGAAWVLRSKFYKDKQN
jgi:hypothetical protein